MMHLFQKISNDCSRNVTNTYSTSFSYGVKLLHAHLRKHIYNIYGFVRLADEIVDTFHDYDKEQMLEELIQQTNRAIDNGISTNPILNSFQSTVNLFDIDRKLIDAFLHSMALDLNPQVYDLSLYEEYIYGSAEVVGLMCLTIFCEGDKDLYHRTEPYARKLGAAFQKVNFLRDISADKQELGRQYFPNLLHQDFMSPEAKHDIEKDIQSDFDEAYVGIKMLPDSSRQGVYLSYIYYKTLFKKIKNTPSQKILEKRIRVPNYNKIALAISSYFTTPSQ